ncbi:MAG: hypothetical protein JW702_08685 [Clostridiales bacterium]|nr:hypothetical protein [Clostridiales bacterium]
MKFAVSMVLILIIIIGIFTCCPSEHSIYKTENEDGEKPVIELVELGKCFK